MSMLMNWEEIKEIYILLLEIEKKRKKEMKRIYDQRFLAKNKQNIQEKKRQQIEQIKKERQENSLIFNGK